MRFLGKLCVVHPNIVSVYRKEGSHRRASNCATMIFLLLLRKKLKVCSGDAKFFVYFFTCLDCGNVIKCYIREGKIKL